MNRRGGGIKIQKFDALSLLGLSECGFERFNDDVGGGAAG
jgi:hypothetical protein